MLRSLPTCPPFQGRVLQVRDPLPAACTALSRSPCVLGLLLRVDNLFNEAIDSNLRPWLEDMPAPQPGIPSGMEPRFVSRSLTGQGRAPGRSPGGGLMKPLCSLLSLWSVPCTDVSNSRYPLTSRRSLASLPPALGVSRRPFSPFFFSPKSCFSLAASFQ